MGEARVWTFFYGSFMNPEVLKKQGIVPAALEAATLNGFDISIRPLANLTRSSGGCVYGAVAHITHAELVSLYGSSGDKLGVAYLPQAVLVHLRNGTWLPAMCYVASELGEGPATNEYVDLIVDSARRYAFPESYIDHLESFRL